ncbi:MAG TPA: helix-turn-helix domain-containing protein [Lactovum miscens]|uniref:helix-turn-helix domain-containing protein n=1 Tax=Lactovum miscens TaxID=190387 RepID=UPI002EDB0BAA
MDNKRLKEIYTAASQLFIMQGYSKTQISHIAKAIGVSVGTIYLDFTGKKEIAHFVLKCTIFPEFMDKQFDRPITDNLFIGLEEEIKQKYDDLLNKLSSHLAIEIKDYTFEQLISESFDLVSRYAIWILFIEKNQYDFDTLASDYKDYRKRFFEVMMQYITAYMEGGYIRKTKYPQYTVHHVIETLAHWAMDIYYNSFEIMDIPHELAKEVVMDNLIPVYKN